MKRRTLVANLAVFGIVPAQAADALSERFDPARDAQADVRQAVARAQAEHKSVLVDVGGEWCVWCHIFDRFISTRREVKDTLQANYVLVKVNYSPQQRNEHVLSQWPKAKGYPHFYVLDGAGRLVASQASGELEAGNDYDESKMLAFLRRHRQTP